jgi:hypothetical protein
MEKLSAREAVEPTCELRYPPSLKSREPRRVLRLPASDRREKQKPRFKKLGLPDKTLEKDDLYPSDSLSSRLDELESRVAHFEAEKAQGHNSDLDDIDEYQLENLNALAVVCMKGFDWNDSRQPKRKILQGSILESASRILARLIDPHGLRILLIFFALLLSFVMVIILAGLEDQFAAIKALIYGDGYYYSYTWRYTGTSSSRDTFQPVRSSNGTLIGYTAGFLGPARPAEEVQLCDSILLPFAGLHFAAAAAAAAVNDSSLAAADAPPPPAGFPAAAAAANSSTGDDDAAPPGGDDAGFSAAAAAAAFWDLTDDVRNRGQSLRRAFASCLAWEYAPLCLGAYDHPPAAGDPPARAALRANLLRVCGATGFRGLGGPALGRGDWAGLAVPPEEVVAARARRLAPRRVEGRLDLALWVMTYQVILDNIGQNTVKLQPSNHAVV